jgi:hypothetical protein
MSVLKDEFLKAARETPRLFFAPVVGAVEAVSREFKSSKKKGDKDSKDIVIHARTFRIFRRAAHKARMQAAKSSEKSA